MKDIDKMRREHAEEGSETNKENHRVMKDIDKMRREHAEEVSETNKEYHKVMKDIDKMRQEHAEEVSVAEDCETLSKMLCNVSRVVIELKSRIKVVEEDMEKAKETEAKLKIEMEEIEKKAEAVRRQEVLASWEALKTGGPAVASMADMVGPNW